ncbi:MAG: ParB/RepB/Spo0J family partition protein [Gallionellaceae bacterium]|jgi:ParB family chromosome partitioning protein|nr:ParB/RepB/Spo0J family partition protein [Gallionellaceae bacterium]
MAKPNKGLGRGLDALLSGGSAEIDAEGELRELRVDQLKPGKYQPRSRMDETSLNELAASIKEQGVIQPILARILEGGNHEIIAGERRWRAAQLAGLSAVPVRVLRNVGDNAALAMALIENIQREDLSPLEEAAGIQRLINEFRMTHQAAADAVGRSRSAASNLLRLLKLPEVIQEMLMQGRLEMGHARALLALDGANQIAAANKIAAEARSVREAEKLVQELLNPASPQEKKKKHVNRDIVQLQEKVADSLGAKVAIRHGAKGAGKLVIEYRSSDQLEGILAKMGVL